MPNGNRLTITDRKIILNMCNEGFNANEILQPLTRFRKAIYPIFQDLHKENMTHRPDRQPIISSISNRHLIRGAKNRDMNARKLQDLVDSQVSIERVRHFL